MKEFTRPEDSEAEIKKPAELSEATPDSAATTRSRTSSKAVHKDPDLSKKPDAKLYEEEERGSGRIPMSVYRRFFGNMGSPLSFILFIIVCVISSLLFMLAQSWIAYWTSDVEGDDAGIGGMES